MLGQKTEHFFYLCAMNLQSQNFKLGVLGGGQLGRMMIQAAIDLDIYIKILDPDAHAPCAKLAHEFVHGSFLDYQTVIDFGQDCDTITIEIENVNLEALEALEAQGKKVFPQPKVLRIIQDKRIQKQFYQDNGIPTAPFVLTDTIDDIKANEAFLPAFNKLGKGGYDGKGVQKITSSADFDKAFTAPSLLEKAIDFDKELAIIVARNASGEISTFPMVEMAFHPTANLVEFLFSPTTCAANIEENAKKIAVDIAQKLDIVGLLAVEMFLTKNGEILVNEIAPRTHNSGHHTIKANYTSQFEQHLRSVLGMPLGITDALMPAAMVNVLGEVGYEGDAVYQGMDTLLAQKGIFPFLYGKKTTKPFRKMGHVTILAENLDLLRDKANFVKENLKVIST